MSKKSGALQSARVLVGVTMSVVVSFLGATLAAERYADRIGSPVDLIVTNAMPSVQALSRARAAVVDIVVALEDTHPGQRAPADLRDKIVADQRQITASVATYLALPFFPTEHTLAAPLDEAVPAFNRAVTRLLEATADAAPPENTRASLAEARHRALALDETLAALVEFDATQGQRLGMDILQTRSASRSLMAMLDLVAVALAVLATLLAARTLRRTLALLDESRARAEVRADEFERRTSELDQFSGRVAHDLLGPMSVAALALSSARDRYGDDERLVRMTTRGLSALGRVRALVDALLEFARAGARPSPGAVADVRSVSEELIDALGNEADRGNVDLVLRPVPECQVACSRGVLVSLLGNLLRNAIKYMGNAGQRRVELRVLDAASYVRFEVEDTGPGIPAEVRSRIFEPYFRAPGKDEPGLGLGLATVERLVHAHGGKLGVEGGRRDTGTLFWFELPRAGGVSEDRAFKVLA